MTDQHTYIFDHFLWTIYRGRKRGRVLSPQPPARVDPDLRERLFWCIIGGRRGCTLPIGGYCPGGQLPRLAPFLSFQVSTAWQVLARRGLAWQGRAWLGKAQQSTLMSQRCPLWQYPLIDTIEYAQRGKPHRATFANQRANRPPERAEKESGPAALMLVSFPFRPFFRFVGVHFGPSAVQ